jgi:hypothetical protein
MSPGYPSRADRLNQCPVVVSYGATDELGYNAVENIFHIRDFHATMLHLLGIDHERLSVRFQGLDARLTGVEEAHVLKAILA